MVLRGMFYLALIVLGQALLSKLAGKILPKRPAQNTAEIQDSGLEFASGCVTFLLLQISVVWIAFPSWFTFASLRIPVLPATVIGLILGLAGILLVVKAKRAIGKNFVGGIGLFPEHRLVTNGPYRFIRNPCYVGYIVSAVGLVLLSRSLFFGGCYLIPALLFLPRIPQEERILEERFGQVFLEYKSRTGRFLPQTWRRRWAEQ